MTNEPTKMSSRKLEIPAHWKDTTSENSGTKYAIVGASDQQPKAKPMDTSKKRDR
jgi:hypothetical protein